MFSSVQFSPSVLSGSLRPHDSQHTRPPCPSPTPSVHPNSCPLSRWCHQAISTSFVPFSSCPQSFPASGTFKWVNSSHEVAKLLEFQLQHQSLQWTPRTDLWTSWISLQPKGLSRVFSNTIVQKHQFFTTQLSSQSNSHIHTWPLEKYSLDQTDLCWQSNISAFQYAI